MFEWFYGHPEKEAEREFLKFKIIINKAKDELLEKNIKKCKKLLALSLISINDLENRINEVSLPKLEEQLNKLDEKVKEEILENKKIKIVHDSYYHYLKDLLKNVNTAKEAIEELLKDLEFAGSSKEDIEGYFEELIYNEIKKIKKDLDGFIQAHDFLEYLHLNPEEVEFYTMKKRGMTKSTLELTFYIGQSKYIIYNEDQKIIKKNIIFITGNKNNHHVSNKISSFTDKHIRKIISGAKREDGSQFLKKGKDTRSSMKKVWGWEAKSLQSNNFEWRKPVLIFNHTFKEEIGDLRESKKNSHAIKTELHLGAGEQNALMHGYPY